MTRVARAYLPFATIVLATMATRVGWIDWPMIGLAVAVAVIYLVPFIILPTIVIGVLLLGIIKLARWLLRLARVAPTAATGPSRVASGMRPPPGWE